MIDNKKLIGNYTYSDLHRNWTHIYINNPLSTEELENFKFLGENVTIEIKQNNYLEIIKIQNKLKEFEKNNDIGILIKDKEQFNNQLVNNPISGDNIYVQTHKYLMLDDYLKYENRLYDLLKGCENLSPFEKYIFIYNIVKKFKKYNSNKNDNSENYDLYKILDNEYINCAGFSILFGDLLNKAGIQNREWAIEVDISYDDSDKYKEELLNNKTIDLSGHSRRIVHIQDEKYNLDGIYIADPTWDNDLEHDYYNYLALTTKESETINRMQKLNLDNQDELFFIDSIDEFYQKLNFILDKNKYYSNESFYPVIDDLIYDIEKLDSKFVKNLKEKYKFIDEWSWPKDISDLVYDLGDYILNHVNKELSGKKIEEALVNVYTNAYGLSQEEADKKVSLIMEENIERQVKCFPKRYKIKDDDFEVIMNENNKFNVFYSRTK